MKIEIDVPDTTRVISVSVVYEMGKSHAVSVSSRCFSIVDGRAEDETGSNKVVQGGADNA